MWIGSSDLSIALLGRDVEPGLEVVSFSPQNCADRVAEFVMRERAADVGGRTRSSADEEAAESFRNRGPGTSMTKNEPIWLITRTPFPIGAPRGDHEADEVEIGRDAIWKSAPDWQRDVEVAPRRGS